VGQQSISGKVNKTAQRVLLLSLVFQLVMNLLLSSDGNLIWYTVFCFYLANLFPLRNHFTGKSCFLSETTLPESLSRWVGDLTWDMIAITFN